MHGILFLWLIQKLQVWMSFFQGFENLIKKMIFSQMPGKNESCAVIVRTELTLKPYPLMNAFLVGIKSFLRKQYLVTHITPKPDSVVNIVSVFPQVGLRRELHIALRTGVSDLFVVSLNVKSYMI